MYKVPSYPDLFGIRLAPDLTRKTKGLSMRTSIGLDIGRSAVKIVAAYDDGHGNPKIMDLTFKSSFSKAIKLTDQGAAARAELDSVTVAGQTYFVGDTAITQGRDDMISGLTDDWAFGLQHAALMLSAMKRLTAAGVPGVQTALLCVGLPAHLHETQSKAYALAVSEHAPMSEVKVIPQSMGPYYAMLFNEHGEELTDLADKSWAIVEIGQYTTDFAMIERGVATQRSFGSCEGMRIAAENLQKEIQAKHSLKISLVEATDMLASAELKSFGERIDVRADVLIAVEPLAEMIVNKAQQIFGSDLRTLDGFCLAGGGASLIKDAISNKWSKTSGGKSIPPSFVSIAKNPRFAVAAGFCRFAQALELSRHHEKLAQAEEAGLAA
jgi:plasmid segregation protein ParM